MNRYTPTAELRTDPPEERLRALHRKCFAELILLSPEALADEFPELLQLTRARSQDRPEQPAEAYRSPD